MTIIRAFFAAIMAGTLCVLCSGCAVTRKSATLDSTSRTPFLNLELAPQQREPAPETQRISRDREKPVGVEPAKLVANGVPKESSWWQRLTGTEQRPAISLPRTDLAKTAAAEKPEEAESVSLEPEFW